MIPRESETSHGKWNIVTWKCVETWDISRKMKHWFFKMRRNFVWFYALRRHLTESETLFYENALKLGMILRVNETSQATTWAVKKHRYLVSRYINSPVHKNIIHRKSFEMFRHHEFPITNGSIFWRQILVESGYIMTIAFQKVCSLVVVELEEWHGNVAVTVLVVVNAWKIEGENDGHQQDAVVPDGIGLCEILFVFCCCSGRSLQACDSTTKCS
jgi:hypothetical protein